MQTEVKYVLRGTPPRMSEEGDMLARGTPSPFKGEVVLLIPAYRERFQLAKEIQYQPEMNAEGIVIEASKYDQAAKTNIQLADMVEKHVKSMAIVHIKSKKPFSSLKELEIHSEFQAVIIELAKVLMGGIPLGED